MNLAYRDIKHNLLRFVLTNFGLSLLLGIVIVITGVYGGLIDDALRQARAANADLWVVEAGTNGPFAESSRIPGDTRELVSRVYGVQRAGSVTYQSVQTQLNGKPLRLFLIGYELGRPGGPRILSAGRDVMRSHYEMVVDRSAGLALGQEVPLGTHGHNFTVVGLMRNELTSSGDPVGYITLHDAQDLQFELAPPAERREVARGGSLETNDQINAVITKVSPNVPVMEVAAALARWKHLTTLTQAQQESLVEQGRHREIAQAAAYDYGAANHRICSHHRLDRLYANHGQSAVDCHAQVRRRAGSDHHRPHRPAGSIDGNIWLLHRAGARSHFPVLLSAAARAGLRKYRSRVRHHGGDLPCRQHSRHSARPQNRSG